MKRVLRILAGLAVLLVVAAGGSALWLRQTLRASLPMLEGESSLPGLSAPVRVEHDALGVPTIRGATRDDVAGALGFLHAQNRYFQMDLLRRSAAGELAELVGPAVAKVDRGVRLHRFRDMARRIAARQDAEAASLRAYSAGVNAGLAALGARPPEYLALRTKPAPWLPEDSVLVMLAMFLDLHDDDGSHESALGLMSDLLPGPLFAFLSPRGTAWDAPVVGSPFEVPPVPGPEVVDLRSTHVGGAPAARPADPGTSGRAMGSNNWAVAGSLTADGGALLANDMHLGISVPNIWYRASLEYPSPGDGRPVRATGVTLPGTPVLVAGSNGRVAWGYTNSYGDWTDLITLEVDPSDPESYMTPAGPRRLEHHTETIRVRGGDDETLDVAGTIWGPVIDKDHRGRPRALSWTAHHDEAVNLRLGLMETAASVEEAQRLAPTIGIPPQNLVTADAAGNIGWTIIGAIPLRRGFDGRLPVSWAGGMRRWDGWLPAADYPRIVNPPTGRVWTANARVVEGEMLARIGDGGYDLGARAGQIRDGLAALQRAEPLDLLAIQLDDRALFLARWRDLLLELLTPGTIAADPRRGVVRQYVERWGARASVDSVGYRLVRSFRWYAARQVLDGLTAPCRAADAQFNIFETQQWEGPLWKLVTERPAHMLDPRFSSWEDQLLSALAAALDTLLADGFTLERRTWGQRNLASMRHPLSLGVPALSRWLDIPPRQLPGDIDMPRVQSTTFGASQRMVVSPGREQKGIFHMPGGQSGHFLSPHYADGHDAWAEGRPTPFLPGPPVRTLILSPSAPAGGSPRSG